MFLYIHELPCTQNSFLLLSLLGWIFMIFIQVTNWHDLLYNIESFICIGLLGIFQERINAS